MERDLPVLGLRGSGANSKDEGKVPCVRVCCRGECLDDCSVCGISVFGLPFCANFSGCVSCHLLESLFRVCPRGKIAFAKHGRY